jgi:hypothetical protein
MEEESKPLCGDFSQVFLWFSDESHQLTIQLGVFGIGGLLLWITVSYCLPCVFIVLAISAVLCFQYRLMNIILWAAIIVLWLHGWRLGGAKGLSLSWE